MGVTKKAKANASKGTNTVTVTKGTKKASNSYGNSSSNYSRIRSEIERIASVYA